MFSWYQYLIVNWFFSHLGFWSGSHFLIAPFPDLCLLVPFHRRRRLYVVDDICDNDNDGAWVYPGVIYSR